MSATTLTLVLVSALTHAVWNAVLKRCREPENAVVGMMFVGGASALFFAFVLRAPFPPRASAFWALASGLLEACYFVALARALARAPLGSVYTVARGGALVIVWPTSVLILHETVNLARVAGTALVIVGLAATGSAERQASAGADGAARRAGLAYAVLAALFIGGFNLTYKLALSSGGAPAALNGISLATASALNISLLRSRRGAALAAVRTEPVRVVVGGLLGSGGFLFFLAAMKDAGAGVVLTLRNTSILFAQLLAIALGERPKALALAGAAVVTAGAILLAL